MFCYFPGTLHTTVDRGQPVLRDLKDTVAFYSSHWLSRYYLLSKVSNLAFFKATMSTSRLNTRSGSATGHVPAAPGPVDHALLWLPDDLYAMVRRIATVRFGSVIHKTVLVPAGSQKTDPFQKVTENTEN